MHRPVKYVEKGLSVAANGAWVVFNTLNKIKQNPGFTPRWSDKPLLKSSQKIKPPRMSTMSPWGSSDGPGRSLFMTE